MEKLSKLTNNMVSLERINFSGFSTSKKWEGCFEKRGSFDFSLIEDAIGAVQSFFGSHWNDFFSISALSYNDEIELHKKMPKEYHVFYEHAKEKGYLRKHDDYFESYLYGDIPLPASSLSIHFDDDFFDISRLVMGHGGVIGQVLFSINIKIGVVLYPHDDIGFGIISIKDNDKLCREFLHSIDKDKFRIIT